MNGRIIKFLRREIFPLPPKNMFKILIDKHGEQNIIDGNMNVSKQLKRLWTSASNEEKTKWKKELR